MKNIIIVVLAIASLTFGTLYFKQGRKVTESETRVAGLQGTVEDLQTQVADQEKRAANLQTRLQDTRAKAVAKADQVSHLEQALTNSATADSKKENPLAEMFKNPEMKELIKTQQKTFLSGFIDKNYAPFVSGMQLNPEQSAAFKELVLKKAMVGAQAGVALMSGDNDPAKRTESIQQIKTETDAANAEIKTLLGDDAYAQFQAYEKTQPERMAVNTFKEQQASGPNALNPDQEAQLLQAMAEEKQNFKFTTDLTDQSKFDSDFLSSFTEEKVNQFQKEFETLTQKYVDRATGILSGEQLAQYQKFVTSQMDMQKLGLKMAAQMFGPKK